MQQIQFDVLGFELQGKKMIEASAGTGKTFSVAILVVRLLVETETDIKSILMNQIKYHLDLYLTSQLSTTLNVTNISIYKCNLCKFFKNISIKSNKNNTKYCNVSKKLTLINFICVLNDVEDGGTIEFCNDYKIKP